ncbi:Aste57867_21544 [Aphanomyces stellatus]|uniref:Aste57867_21544 protein n=1 Tax=Aphanomyces stellatus TaxID=120398 RepID=A0A485LHS0_9STRA|nr:hypothetical protein As57867_021475 [Aphanomyces stellatus]VFT98214.1 Aste57867_21544 [Aphanomyces stellatus]
MELMARPPLEINFTASNFRSQYQRNNKKGGLKNLRCFPNCCSGMHASSGFCGGSVLVGIRADHVRGRNKIAVFAEFCAFVDGHPQGHAALDDALTLERIQTLSNKDNDVHAPWYAGDILQGSHDEGYIFSINTFKRGWHYGWTSNRHTSVTQHVLCVYAFELHHETGLWYCVGVSSSPPFQLYCRRRAKSRTAVTAASDEDDKTVKEEDEDDGDETPPPEFKRARSSPDADRDFLLPPSCVMEIPELLDFCNE